MDGRTNDGWYTDEQVDDHVLRAISASRGRPVELADVFERIDAAERWVPSQPVLDASLRRLGSAGRIRRVGTAFVDGLRSTLGEQVHGLSPEAYEAGLRRYHAEFARDAERFFRNPVVRAVASKFGDVDRAAIEYAVERVVAPFGGRVVRTTRRGTTLAIHVEGLDVGTDEGRLVEQLREAVRDFRQDGGRVIIRLLGGGAHEVG